MIATEANHGALAAGMLTSALGAHNTSGPSPVIAQGGQRQGLAQGDERLGLARGAQSPGLAQGTWQVGARLEIRAAQTSDRVPLGFFFDAILRRDYFLRRGQLSDLLASRRHRVLVAEVDAILVGVAILTRGARLVNVLVHPAYRGLGIGSALVQASGAQEVQAKRDMSGGDPRGFYARLGFRPTGQTNRKGNVELMRRDGDRLAGESSAPGTRGLAGETCTSPAHVPRRERALRAAGPS